MIGREPATQSRTFSDPARLRELLGSTRFAGLWLLVRVYIGWGWLMDGWNKLQSPNWMSGAELRRVWVQAADSNAVPSSTSNWFHPALHFLLRHGSEVWLGKAVAIGETLLGIAMILGFLTALTAVAGSLLGVNAAVVGAGIADPLSLALAFALVLAWKTSGWIGFDRWLLPILGAPWESGQIVGRGVKVPDSPAFHVEV